MTPAVLISVQKIYIPINSLHPDQPDLILNLTIFSILAQAISLPLYCKQNHVMQTAPAVFNLSLCMGEQIGLTCGIMACPCPIHSYHAWTKRLGWWVLDSIWWFLCILQLISESQLKSCNVDTTSACPYQLQMHPSRNPVPWGRVTLRNRSGD